MAGILLNRSRQAPAEDTPAFGGIAERFRRAGDLDRAIALCRDGLKKFPKQLSARVTLGWSLIDKGLYDEARQELEAVLRGAPDNLAAIRGLAELHDRTENHVDSSAWHQPSEPEAAAPAPVEFDAEIPADPSAGEPMLERFEHGRPIETVQFDDPASAAEDVAHVEESAKGAETGKAKKSTKKTAKAKEQEET